MRTCISFFIALAGLTWTACTSGSGSAPTAGQPAPGFVDSLPGSCAHLTRDEQGRVVLSWIRELSDSSAVFCYAVSPDGGHSFEAPVMVAGSGNIKPHAENLPQVIFKPSGEVLAVWGAASNDPRNKYSGRIFYTQSFDSGRNWTPVQPLVQDTAGYDQRYFDMALLPSGEVAIIWLDNRKTADGEGSAMYLATTRSTSGFEGERRIAEPCCPCCRTDLFVDSRNNIHVIYRGILQDSIRDMVHTVSTDGGETFRAPQRISPDNWVLNGCPHTGPAMTENRQGLHFAWYTGGQRKGSFYTASVNNGASFAAADSVALAGKHPQLAAGEEGGLALVWDEHVQVGKSFYSRIGIQQRTEEGKSMKKWYLTPDTAYATFPVIIPVKGSEMLVAWSQKRGENSYIACRTVQLEKK